MNCLMRTGDYEITFSYFDEPICAKPFTPKAWDACAIKVTGIKPGTVCKPNTFNGMLTCLVLLLVTTLALYRLSTIV